MIEAVLVSIRGFQFGGDNGEDSVEVVTNGKYKKKGNKGFLRFEQYEEGEAVSKNILTFEDGSVSLTRRGGSQLHMSFIAGKKTLTSYGTPFGEIVLGIDTTSIRIDESEKEIKLTINYKMDMNYEYLTDCELTVVVTPRV
ncbi:Uncharacterized beta-barrel protein YwiB, DUF1934 family [Lachnospiraceae bacterium]|nr:Uncharacterized beta-barrel protein YwiB, DUF1934 family [Lachnospiraceae bacterium]